MLHVCEDWCATMAVWSFAKASILCSSPRLPGDNVSQCFYRVAADLAGVVLTKPELEVASKVVKAEIINHPQVKMASRSLRAFGAVN